MVSGGWAKNVAIYPTINHHHHHPHNHQEQPDSGSEMLISSDEVNVEKMPHAKAILSCRPNSHFFQDRTLTLDQPVKIGRSVARTKPTSTNAIFDCKVLSRHHALLWYENGKFYLQDTKSSNGTFVNNTRLTAETENHEVSSGDIVQFGVDVLENNRKVTHGCIIATLKLYMPDGKEAKASPSITEGDRHGMVPLDDLYRLNQIIQEANQREQCLETKLTALRLVVEETKKAAEESWQVYVGEERLLSRLSALEQQLQQCSKNFGEDRLREELAKLQEHSETYQTAAKEALEKVHAERLAAIAAANEQEQARITAEQEAMLAREQLRQTEALMEELVQQLNEERKKVEESKARSEERERELVTQLEEESGRLMELQERLYESVQYTNQIGNTDNNSENNPLWDESKLKEQMNENGIVSVDEENNQDIKLTVAPITENNNGNEDEGSEKQDTDSRDIYKEMDGNGELSYKTDDEESSITEKDEVKRVMFKMPESGVREEDSSPNETKSENDVPFEDRNNDSSSSSSLSPVEEEDESGADRIDSKTLKYQYQSAQNELKRKMEILEAMSNSNKVKIDELDRALAEEKEKGKCTVEENESLKHELIQLQQKWKESCNENQQLRDKVLLLSQELEKKEGQDSVANSVEKSPESELRHRKQNAQFVEGEKPSGLVCVEQVVKLEEELVALKERCAQIGEEKLKLQHDLLKLTEQYNLVCNKSNNKMFVYFAILVLMVIYLLVSAMNS